MPEPKGWKELPIGGIIDSPGSARDLETGAWRARRPIVDTDKCTSCLQCWMFCPDMAVVVQADKMRGFDLYHCKGCGICAKICPADAIAMVAEAEAGTEGEGG